MSDDVTVKEGERIKYFGADVVWHNGEFVSPEKYKNMLATEKQGIDWDKKAAIEALKYYPGDMFVPQVGKHLNPNVTPYNPQQRYQNFGIPQQGQIPFQQSMPQAPYQRGVNMVGGNQMPMFQSQRAQEKPLTSDDLLTMHAQMLSRNTQWRPQYNIPQQTQIPQGMYNGGMTPGGMNQQSPANVWPPYGSEAAQQPYVPMMQQITETLGEPKPGNIFIPNSGSPFQIRRPPDMPVQQPVYTPTPTTPRNTEGN